MDEYQRACLLKALGIVERMEPSNDRHALTHLFGCMLNRDLVSVHVDPET